MAKYRDGQVRLLTPFWSHKEGTLGVVKNGWIKLPGSPAGELLDGDEGRLFEYLKPAEVKWKMSLHVKDLDECVKAINLALDNQCELLHFEGKDVSTTGQNTASFKGTPAGLAAMVRGMRSVSPGTSDEEILYLINATQVEDLR